MVGNLLALFMIEVIGDALEDIPSSSSEQAAMLNGLISKETADHERFLQSEPPELMDKWDAPDFVREKIRRTFYKDRNVCHLALLPSESRYRGILTESQPVTMFDLPDGLLSSQVRDVPNDGNGLRLVGDADTRQECEVPLNVDHQDFFYIDSGEGWKELTLPNKAEIQEYRSDGEPFKGVLFTCYVGCPWNKCPKGNIIGGIEEKTVQMEVNDVPVTSLFQVHKVCYLLQHSEGTFWKANSYGRFNIRVRVAEHESYVRFSSFMIW